MAIGGWQAARQPVRQGGRRGKGAPFQQEERRRRKAYPPFCFFFLFASGRVCGMERVG